MADLFIHLYHGRVTPDEHLDDWGKDGPTFGPYSDIQVTYGSHIKLNNLYGRDELFFDGEYVVYDGVYYGDISIFTKEFDARKNVSSYQPEKAMTAVENDLITMTFDEFKEKFAPQENPHDSDAPFDRTMLETYGEEYDTILSVKKHFPNCVWTVVTDDEENLVIVNGWHLANRIGYIVTKTPWEQGKEYNIEEAE